MKLLNPGPVTLTNQVRQALLREDICHRESEFSLLQSSIRSELVRVYKEAEKDYTAVLITGSGTAAVESMVSSLVPKTSKALVMVNGAYGERMVNMLTVQGKEVYIARSDWTQDINLELAETLLKENPEITHVLAVHHETTTGRLNDIPSLAKLCRKYHKNLLLDAVSSFAGEEIHFNEWNLEACAATANKCLHGVPGISFVIVRKDSLEKKESAATSIYLDLFRHFQEQNKNSTAFTPAIQVCYALSEALKELESLGGWQIRHSYYKTLAKKIFQGLRDLGVKTLLEIDSPSSVVLTAYQVPKNHAYKDLHDFIKSQGYVIYSGLGKFSSDIFRISTMGDFNHNDAKHLLSVFKEFLEQ
ncbi:MAG: 2-aminoethylphosphonate--pyruvate transaminase [Acidobacteria bacterium]|nr:2-aminoethylphosphonate--pyruvate transaminase [Acidobacteriota bacterium]